MGEERRTTTTGFGDVSGRFLRRYRKDQLIVVEGQASNTFVILRRGIVGIYKDGQRVAVVSEPGSYLGEMSYLLRDKRTATMRAENDVEACVMPGQSLEEILDTAPRVGLKIMQSLASRLRTTTSENAGHQRQINRLRSGGAAPDIRTSTSDRRGVSYPEQAIGELVFLIRVALEFSQDDPILLALLRSALHTDLVSEDTHLVPDRERLLDVINAARGPDAGPVDLRQVVDRVKRGAVTPPAAIASTDAALVAIRANSGGTESPEPAAAPEELPPPAAAPPEFE